jgi:CTP synthase (UTP-ammonia lyase)
MGSSVRIALVGDYNQAVLAHQAIPVALQLSAQRLSAAVAPVWMHTAELKGDCQTQLGDFAGVWCVPASPYANTHGALAAIRLARTSGLPFLGTCGGFQHALLEYARNVLGLDQADHAELSPGTEMPLIARLSCALVEKTGTITFTPASRLRAIYGTDRADEGYHCSYGLNPAYERLFHGGALKVAGRDAAGEVRAIELTGHPFFTATLFQPERAALAGREHPLISAFVAAAAATVRH